MLSLLCQPLVDGEAWPARVDTVVANELGVTPNRIEPILRPLYSKFGVLDDESRVTRLVLAAVQTGLLLTRLRQHCRFGGALYWPRSRGVGLRS